MTPRIDVRWPIGLLWIVIGVLLAAYGVMPRHEVARSLAVDRLWGCVMLTFGIVMLAAAAGAPEKGERGEGNENDTTAPAQYPSCGG
jgi:hypothetical protein